MANYDQSGNPVGRDRQQGSQQPQGSQQGGSFTGGQAGAGRGSQTDQQSQYSSGSSQGRTQGTGSVQQSSGRGMTGSGFTPDLYSGFGGGPFQLISRLSDEMDRIFESFGMGSTWPRISGSQPGMQSGRGGGQGIRTLWAPHIEVCERNGKLLIQADLPGVRKEDVDVQIEDDAVIIQGQRHQESERNEQGFYHSERSYGGFYRMIPLPEGVDANQANATFRDGVLQIELPAPQQRPRGRRLEIRDGSSNQGPLGSSETSSPSGQQQAEGSSERR